MQRKFLSGLIGLALFGCGADPGNEPRTSSQRVVSEHQVSTPASPEAPRETVVALQICVDRYAPRLSSDSYAVMFDVETNASGQVIAVKIKDSMIEGSDLERCLTRALGQMDASVATNMQHDVSPQSRSMVGIVQAAAAPIAMLPIVLAAAGVTIVVGVTIYVATEALKEKERCRQVKADCLADCSIDTLHQGRPEPEFTRCMRACLEKANCW